MLATLSSADLSVLFWFAALVALGLGIWRAAVRDVLGAILLLGAALVAAVLAAS